MVQSQNPFATPQADPMSPQPDLVGDTDVLAERGTRLGAAIVDGIVAILVMVPAMVVQRERLSSGSQFWFVGSSPAALASTVLWVGLLLFQAYLVATSGQTIGKKALGIKIVRMDGQPVSFVNGVLLRTWLLQGIMYIPVIGQTLGGLLALVDVLMIFGDERRCLHDRVAGTKVVLARKL